jgi:hypothetical protein
MHLVRRGCSRPLRNPSLPPEKGDDRPDHDFIEPDEVHVLTPVNRGSILGQTWLNVTFFHSLERL